jgi:hypothetical protein
MTGRAMAWVKRTFEREGVRTILTDLNEARGAAVAVALDPDAAKRRAPMRFEGDKREKKDS